LQGSQILLKFPWFLKGFLTFSDKSDIALGTMAITARAPFSEVRSVGSLRYPSHGESGVLGLFSPGRVRIFAANATILVGHKALAKHNETAADCRS
jgi:hypothetical protein